MSQFCCYFWTCGLSYGCQKVEADFTQQRFHQVDSTQQHIHEAAPFVTKQPK